MHTKKHLDTMARSLFAQFLLFILLLFVSNSAQAGPWSRAPGKFYVKAHQGFLFSSDPTPAGVPEIPYFDSTTSLYAEVGIFYGLQAQLFLPYKFARHTTTARDDEFYSISSFGDAIVGLQWTPPFLMKKLGIPIALRMNYKVAMYDFNTPDEQPGATNVSNKFPKLGEGQLDTTFWLSAGGNIPGVRGLYAFAELGYRLRSEIFIVGNGPLFNPTFQDCFVYNAQVGYFVGGKVLVMLNSVGIIPVEGDPNLFTKGMIAFGLGLYIPVYKGLAIEVNADGSVYAVNADRMFSFGFGISYQK